MNLIQNQIKKEIKLKKEIKRKSKKLEIFYFFYAIFLKYIFIF